MARRDPLLRKATDVALENARAWDVVLDVAATSPGSPCVFCRRPHFGHADNHESRCVWRRAKELIGDGG